MNILLLFSFTILLISCGGKSSSDGGGGGTNSFLYTKSPKGGFVSALASPTTGTIVAGGENGLGLFYSSNSGTTWNRATVPGTGFTASAIAVAPSSTSRLVAIDYYGKGLLVSVNSGTSWTAAGTGLPSFGSTYFYDVAIHPTSSNIVIVATSVGLYYSSDYGVSFSIISSLSGDFRAVAFSPSGYIFAGLSTGQAYYSTNQGSSWTLLLSASAAIQKIATTSYAVYLALSTADVFRYLYADLSSGTVVNNSSSSITTGAKVSLWAISKSTTYASDELYLGTSINHSAATTRWGIFKSANGGGSWSQLTSGISGVSIGAVARDASASAKVYTGAADGDGFYISADSGSSWTSSNSNLEMFSPLGFAQSASNPSFLVASSSLGGGLSRSGYSSDGGSSWTDFSEVNSTDGVASFSIHPTNADNILAGTLSYGVYSSSTGVNGPWTRTLSANIRVDRLIRDASNTSIVYALSDSGLYYSADGGASFTARAGTTAYDVAVHPTTAAQALSAEASDVYTTSDGFSTKTALGLSSYAAAQGKFTAVAFKTGTPTTVMAGGAAGGLFLSTNYSASGTGVTWSQVSSLSLSNVGISNIVFANKSDGRSYIYVATYAKGFSYSSSSTVGVYRSTDGGSTWSLISGSYSVLRYLPSYNNTATQFWLLGWDFGLINHHDL